MAKVRVKKIDPPIPGGDEKPKKETKKAVFTSQAEIDAANREAKRLAAKAGADEYIVSNAHVARDVGDAKPEYVGLDGQPITQAKVNVKLAETLPSGITVEDVYRSKDGLYYFNHPQSGNATPVNAPLIFAKYGRKPNQTDTELATNKVKIKVPKL